MAATGFWRRLWRHAWWDDGDRRRHLDDAALERLRMRVQASEARHSGEIRVCVEASLPWPALRQGVTPRQRAIALFGELGVWDTEANNGVLIYLLLADHAIEIVADRGLVRRVPDAVWAGLVESMRTAFRARRFEDGLNAAVDTVDALLVQHFPLAPGEVNPNELPDAPLVR